MHYDKTVEIDGVKVAIRADAVAGKRWTWRYHCDNGLSAENGEELAPNHVTALSEAIDAAKAALRKQRDESTPG